MAKLPMRGHGLLLLSGLAGACSLINSYDDVAPTKAGGGSGGGGADATMAGSPDVEGGTGNSVAGKGAMAGNPSTNAGEGGVGEGGSREVPATPATGMVVMGGPAVTGTGDVLLAINPKTGKEVSREAIIGASIVGIAYDGAPGKDLWFVFTASNFPADPMSKTDLQVRAFDEANKKFVTLKKVSALPPPRPGSLVLLNDRMAYLSYGLVNGALADTLTILDTSKSASVKQVPFDVPLSGRVLGLVGTRGAPGDVTALGGTLAVATGNGCTGVGFQLKCDSLSLTPIFVGDDITAGVVKNLRGFVGKPAFASAATSQRAFVALPATTAMGNVDVIRFDPRSLAFEAPLSPPTSGKTMSALGFVDCLDVTVFTVLSDFSQWVTSAQGASAKAVLAHQSQDLVYEPFTSSIIAPYNPDNPLFPGADGGGGAGGAGSEPDVVAFAVSKAGVTPAIKQRTTDWSPPTDIAVNVVATRFPVPFACP